ncbi:dienelactone hydrolase family protein [Cohnella sp. AR92]|uniref:dienelactone hydrolase family protein n=1 Tax=Cohnella sp. AR92 TaxID=648716 RepID=UPI000F8D98F4|nr:dienelactone hydrolase family protein [Cohnella sp. AR92]RUS45195.1 hypothetical protein ELR57_19955 [Cohnella sp. AR92]
MSKPSEERALVLVLHEIYGVNDHIRAFDEALTKAGYDTISPNLLGRECFSYEQEEEAYSFFMNEIGFDRALQAIKPIIEENRDSYRRIYIVGFSIGATLAWRCSEYGIDGVVGYYGSRIRSYMEVDPQCPALLIFASRERSFDASELASRLRKKRNTEAEVFGAGHGFMNPFHPAFDSAGYRRGLDRTLEFLVQKRGLP